MLSIASRWPFLRDAEKRASILPPKNAKMFLEKNSKDALIIDLPRFEEKRKTATINLPNMVDFYITGILDS